MKENNDEESSVKPLSFVLLVALLAISATSAQATPLYPLLDLTTDHWPLIYAAYLDADYYGTNHASNTLPNSDTQGLLVLSATVMQFTASDIATPITATGTFNISVAVDPTTGQGLSGSLTIKATRMDAGHYGEYIPGCDDDDVFYSTTLADFGSGVEDKFEFVFTQEGTGMLAPDEEPIGIIVDAREISNFDDPNGPDFSLSEWNNGYGLTANSHAFYMPEPTTLIVLAIAGGLAVVRRRRPREL